MGEVKKSIVIIEDEAGVAIPIQILLEELGFAVFIKSQITENLSEEIRKVNPSLIFLDILLAGVDGRIFCKRIKNDQSLKHIPVVMMSAYPNAKDSTINCGADGYLEKPFGIDDLLVFVHRHSS